MTEHPTHRTDAGRHPAIGNAFGSNSSLISLARPHALLTHVSVFLSASAALALLNLVLDPGALWGRAVMIVWLVLLAGHAVGILILRLLTDDTSASPSPRLPVTPRSSRDGAWPVPPAADASNPTATAASANGWGPALPVEPDPGDLSWPTSPDDEPDPAPAPASGTTGAPRETNGEDRVPWRAATEIAWLRNRREARSDDPRQGRTATGTHEPDA